MASAHAWGDSSEMYVVLAHNNTGIKRHPGVKILQKMDSNICLFSRFTTATAHFHQSISVHPENKLLFPGSCYQRWSRSWKVLYYIQELIT